MSGCNRKCPCSLWINCPQYIDIQKQQYRLARKSYDCDEWYDLYFRTDFRIPDGACSG